MQTSMAFVTVGGCESRGIFSAIPVFRSTCDAISIFSRISVLARTAIDLDWLEMVARME